MTRPDPSVARDEPASERGVIEVRGAWQNNLKGVDVDIPLGDLVVITGPSGSGKSSLAFQTIYAEGQRRYVETFSPYVRQFFDRMDKPKVDEIRGIPPAIAIEQSNQVKTTRSTVGTITEINDYLKLLYPRLAVGQCPECGGPVRPDTATSIREAVLGEFGEPAVLVMFAVEVPAETGAAEFFPFLQSQGYLRVRLFGEIYRCDEPGSYGRKLPPRVDVVQDRVAAGRKGRFLEAVESALHLGKGKVRVVEAESGKEMAFSSAWHCAGCDVALRAPVPGLFSFNNPLGACPACRGFGRVIGIDLERALPDRSLSLREGVVKAFQGEKYQECQVDLERVARRRGLDLDAAFMDLAEEDQQWVIYGEGGDPETAYEAGEWYGVKGFFDWLERSTYKMHVRVFLSRYRSYTECPDCRGKRLQPEALPYRIGGYALPDLWKVPVEELEKFVAGLRAPEGDGTTELLLEQIGSRLGYLNQVGLGYLDLDRSTRTLSGGEIQRVNLTTCLGASLTNTLFVLDEPSIGLHPRDVGRLVEVLQGLRDKGNTLVVVEHEEAVIRAADYLIDVGPGRGEEGGEVVYQGPVEGLEGGERPSLTRDYLLGRKSVPRPETRRSWKRCLRVVGATQHNLKKLDVDIPLGVFTCVTGVSGSGKSTLVHEVIYRNLLRMRGEVGEAEAGGVREIRGAQWIREVVMVDQAPLSRTPRSTVGVFAGAFEGIRKMFAETPDARSRGLPVGYFSFNSGGGRCERCWGTGYEKVEMQFLSDIYVTCPECEGRRYTPETLEVKLEGASIHEVLQMTVREAGAYFGGMGGGRRVVREVAASLAVLEEVGLGYLRLGQPLNALSGGESQRLKLVGHLMEKRRGVSEGIDGSLFILDEPTTGLHFDDIAILLRVLHRLVGEGHTLLVIEHNLEVIRSADWIVDLGPEAGKDGGRLVAQGTPEEMEAHPVSHTGAALRAQRGKQGTALKGTRVRDKLAGGASEGGNFISVSGARENNLKNISLRIPRDQMVTVTGLSGSGKSTLAFDILFAEGQRRFLDSMSAYARQFVEQMEKPHVDHIEGLPPTVAIEQRISRGGGKSTVATVTEVYHFLRLLYAKVGVQHSPATGKAVMAQPVSSIVTRVRKMSREGKVMLLAPLVRGRKGFHTEVAQWAVRQGYEELLVDNQFRKAEGFAKLERFKEHTIEVVVGEVNGETTLPRTRELVEQALKVGKESIRALDGGRKFQVFSTRMFCPESGRSFEELDPRLFSYNSPHGWCPACRGYGEVLKKPHWERERDDESALEAELREERDRLSREAEELRTCEVCGGARLNEVALAVKVSGRTISSITRLSVREARREMEGMRFRGREGVIARDILPEISQRLSFLEEVGLGYLQLDRGVRTLSGGEGQRIRLAAQLGSNLRGVLYVLDEPTIGLHPRDNGKLLDTLEALRGKGNSLLVVEHDEETMRRSDHIIDLGPGAGRFGGEVTASGTWEEILRHEKSATGKQLREPMRHPLRGQRRPLPAKNAAEGWLRIEGARANNLKQVAARIPVGRLTVLCGISGSGKSSLMRGVMQPAVQAELSRKKGAAAEGPWKAVRGAEQFGAVYEVDQSPIGKTSRSCPATYIKVFDEIRKLFAQLPEARTRGFTASRFSFNTEGGRCESCKGNGRIKLEMNFLPVSWVPCEDCAGLRFNVATLEILYRGKSIGEVMQMSVDEAATFFEAAPRIARSLELLRDTGLGYLQLGQASPTLSGGEAQRLKLVSELTRGVQRARNEKVRRNRLVNSFLYLIEEPSIGLHMADVEMLLGVLHRLVDEGATVVVIEHNLDIIAEADYLLEMGPEAGGAGGEVVYAGVPEGMVEVEESRTGPFLRGVLDRGGEKEVKKGGQIRKINKKHKNKN